MRMLQCGAALLALLSVTGAHAAPASKTWIAICNDGKNLEYTQPTATPMGELLLKTDKGTQKVATVRYTSFDQDTVCGKIGANAAMPAICASISRRIIYVSSTGMGDRPNDMGTYCAASVVSR